MSIFRSLVLVLLLAGCMGKQTAPATSAGAAPVPILLTNLPPQVRSFIERKEQSLPVLAKKLEVEVDRPTLEFFSLAKKGEYSAATNLAHELRARRLKNDIEPADAPDFRLPLWEPLLQVEFTLEAYAERVGKFGAMCGEDIAQSMQLGSIFLAGNGAGYALVAPFSKPDAEGEPIIIVSQNTLVDGEYLQYLHAAFGDKAYMPSYEDSQQCFNDYMADAKLRLERKQLKPGEDVKMEDGRVKLSGQVSLMSINALMAKVIFDRNTNRECYYAESFPLDWMYPHLVPHGLIMKVNREPLFSIPAETVAKDHQFWIGKQKELIGDWLKPETSVQELCDFVEKVEVRKDLSGFQGDPEFLRSSYARAAFSKFRVSQGGLYSWRSTHATTPEDKQRMTSEADFAFRQSFAFRPSDLVAIFSYVNLLTQSGRIDDALLIADSASKTVTESGQIPMLIKELQRMKEQQAK